MIGLIIADIRQKNNDSDKYDIKAKLITLIIAIITFLFAYLFISFFFTNARPLTLCECLSSKQQRKRIIPFCVDESTKFRILLKENATEIAFSRMDKCLSTFFLAIYSAVLSLSLFIFIYQCSLSFLFNITSRSLPHMWFITLYQHCKYPQIPTLLQTPLNIPNRT